MRLKFILFISLSFLFTSCFEIIEEITIHEDGSGAFELTLNLSESKSKLASIMLLDSVEGFVIPSKNEISNTILTLVDQAKNTEGIVNVNHSLDYQNYIFSISCDFTNVEALNQVVTRIGELYGMSADISPEANHVTYDKDLKTYNRNGNYITSTEYDNMDQRGKEIMSQSEFISINRFDSEIETALNEQTKISPNKKASMLKLSISDVLSGKFSVGNELHLK